MMTIGTRDPSCSLVVIREVESDYYKIKQPIRVMSITQPDGSFSASIHELEIFVDGIDVEDAFSRAFEEMFFLYDLIVEAPLSYVFNDEILFFRHYLNNHIGRLI